MTKQLSIIIPHYNDVDTTIGTIESLYDTIDIDNFEVIVINDGSQHRLPDSYRRNNMIYASHFVNLGVGQSFDSGVRIASSENLILMGADIRFSKNNWASRMLSVIEKEQKSFVCVTTKSTANPDTAYYGADVIFLVQNQDISEKHPRKNILDYRSVLEGKWRGRTDRGVYPVPSLMGAFYGVKKSWYNEVRGFELHYKWGVLEPYVSLKSWLLGGKVLVDSESSVQHIFNRKPQRSALWDVLVYNQTMLAGTVFGAYGIKYAQWLAQGDASAWQRGSDMYMEKIESISQMCNYLQDKSVITPKQLERIMIDMSVHYNDPKCKYTDPYSV